MRYLAADCGVRQFLDIGTGIPTADNTHEVAQAVAPESRIVYVDNDPVVLLHARALLASHPAGAADYIDADLRDTGTILTAAARTLDFSQPIAIMMLLILHLIPDEDVPVRDAAWPGLAGRRSRRAATSGDHPRGRAVDLLRHEQFLTSAPVPDAVILEIVDEVFLPLACRDSANAGHRRSPRRRRPGPGSQPAGDKRGLTPPPDIEVEAMAEYGGSG